MISQVIDIARSFYSRYKIEQKLISSTDFENKTFEYYAGIFVLDYVMAYGSVSDFTRDWYRLVTPDRNIALLNFAKVYPIDTYYAIVFEYPIIIKTKFTIEKPANFILDTTLKAALGYHLILPR